MGKLQIIHTDGEDLVVIARRDYEALLARAGDEASEDAGFDVSNITLTKTGLFGHVDLREATVFADRPDRVLSTFDRSPHGSSHDDVERYSKRGRDGFERSGGARLLAG
jgi:hypothetical protein